MNLEAAAVVSTAPSDLLLVLLVDDEEAVVKALARDLTTTGFAVETCTDPIVARERINSGRYALIVTDNRMPTLSGVALLEHAAAIDPDMGRIMLTGYAELESVVSAVNQGAVQRFLLKPWNRNELLQHIRECLELTQLKRSNRLLLRELEANNAKLATANDKLGRLASKDGLTGLHNRREFDIQLEREFRLYNRQALPFCLAMADIDDFKRINDSHGHAMGDSVLRTVAQVLKTTIREDVDSVFRYGGEEFTILLRNTTLDGAIHALERILAAVRSARTAIPGGSLQATLSLGCEQYRPGGSKQELIEAADAALYQAKREGKNRCIPALPQTS